MSDRELTERQKNFLKYLFDPGIKGDIRSAMNAAGYSKESSAADVVEALSDEIVELSQKHVKAAAAKATIKMIGVLDDPTELGTDRIIAASKELLDRAGIVKKDKMEVSVTDGTGVLFLPTKNPD